ncbi:hypothetical protein [Candidatus Paracaedibacter symbiosus]|nr:hypothetical protein [Candidatus Paracaedibacter symbiosus]
MKKLGQKPRLAQTGIKENKTNAIDKQRTMRAFILILFNSDSG